MINNRGRLSPSIAPLAMLAFLLSSPQLLALPEGVGELDLPNPTSGFGATILFLLILLAGAAWLHRRLSWNGRAFNKAEMRMTSALSLGEKRAVVIIEVEGRRMLVGVTPSRIDLLCRLRRQAADSERTSAGVGAGGGTRGLKPEMRWMDRMAFPSVLRNAMNRSFRRASLR